MPSPANPPSGCRFHTRCPYAKERCASEPPALRETDAGDGHIAACHYFEEIAAATPDLGLADAPERAPGAAARFALYQDAMRDQTTLRPRQDQE